MKIQYRGVTLDLQSGDIVLFRSEFSLSHPQSYLAPAIRYFTQCYYNHCASVVSNWHQLELNEARAEGITGRPASVFLDRPGNVIKVLRPKAMVSEEEYCTRANRAKGRPYDWKNLAVAHLIYRLTSKWKGKTDEAEAGRMVCSEYCAWTHMLPEWWLMSAKELEFCGVFDVIYVEDPAGEAEYYKKRN